MIHVSKFGYLYGGITETQIHVNHKFQNNKILEMFIFSERKDVSNSCSCNKRTVLQIRQKDDVNCY